MTPAQRILDRLEGVRETGRGAWIARCPAHDDRHPSLAITEKPDGILLLKCFSGCETFSVVEAIGLELRDLFPDNTPDHRSPDRRPFPAATLLRIIAHECPVVEIAAADMAHGKTLPDGDRGRLHMAAQRIRSARRAGGL